MKIRKYKLPLSVRSTAIRVFNLIVEDLEKYRISNEDLVLLAIMIACKCEDVQGGIDSMLHRLAFDRRVELTKIENMILSNIGFNLFFPSPYTKVYAILVILQERDLLQIIQGNRMESAHFSSDGLYYVERNRVVSNDLDSIWDKAIENIDYMLCLDNRNWTDVELAYASLGFPVEIFKKLSFTYSEDNLSYLSTNVNKLKEEFREYNS